MKVFYIIDSFTTGGAEKSLLNILRNFHNVEPVVCGIYGDSTLLPSYIESGIKTYHLNIRDKYGWRKAYTLLSSLILRERPDLIHSTLFRSNILARFLAKEHKIPLVNSLVSDSYGAVRKSQMSFIRRIKLEMTFQIDRYTAKHVRRFVANSEAIKLSNSKVIGIDIKKIDVIYRGRDPQIFLIERDQEVANLRESLQISLEDFIFVNVGRLIESKGQLDILKAITEIKKIRPNVQVLIAGEGPYRTELQKYVASHNLAGNVRLLGNREDVPVLLKLGNAFVFPTYYEGQSGALIEAMFAGIPIIASNIPPNLETVDGSMAKIFSLGDVSALTSSMLDCINNKAEYFERARNATSHALKLFDIKCVSRSYEKFYGDILSDNMK